MFFEFGMAELMMIAVVGLLVIGPERLPETLRTIGLWLGRLRRSFVSVKAEIEKEIGMDEVKRQLHNEAVMDEMKRIEQEVQNSMNEAILDPESAKASQSDSDAQQATTHGSTTPDEAGVSTQDEAEAPDPQPRPTSEAELEALHAARTKQQQADQSS